jgi:hypothetical protein
MTTSASVGSAAPPGSVRGKSLLTSRIDVKHPGLGISATSSTCESRASGCLAAQISGDIPARWPSPASCRCLRVAVKPRIASTSRRAASFVCSPPLFDPSRQRKGEPNGRDPWSTSRGRTGGTPAEPSSFRSPVPHWTLGETIHFGHRTVRVVGVRDDDADQPPVLVGEDVA